MGEDFCDKHGDEPSKVAIFYEDDSGKEYRLTFGDLIRFSNKFANVLRALGVHQGDRVALILSQRPEMAVSILGVYKMGGVMLPLSFLFQKDALETRLRSSEAKAVVVAQEDAHKVRELSANLPDLDKIIVVGEAEEGELRFWDALDSASSDFTRAGTRAEDPATLMYTSGTTGPPKGVLHCQCRIFGQLPGFELAHNFFPKEGDVYWSPADWAWGGGLDDALFPCLHYGVPILAYRTPKFDPERSLHMMGKYGVRNAFIWPTALRMMRQITGIHAKFPSLNLRSIISGGEKVGDETIYWAQQELGVTINEFYGQSEANLMIGNASALFNVKPGSMGKSYPGHTVDTLDSQGDPVGVGEIGIVGVKRPDPTMFLRYWKNEKATRDKFIGDWLMTGDLARKDEDGYFWYVSREDDIISSAGYRIGPSEIEDCLLKHPAVAQAAVVGSPDETRGEIVKAFVQLAVNHSPSDELKKKLQEHIKSRLAYYLYPREVEFVEDLPKTTTGKIKRAELKRLEIERKMKNSKAGA